MSLTARRQSRFPYTTFTVVGITAAITALQWVSPQVLQALRRNPDALARHEWWRLFTPMFVHAEGWMQIGFNLPAILIVGTIVERIYGGRWWLAFYFVSGVVGEIAGYAWKPHGAGASVGGAGLLGALAVWLVRGNGTVQAKFGGGVILIGAAALTVLHDLHGPPIIAGGVMGVAALMRLRSDPSSG